MITLRFYAQTFTKKENSTKVPHLIQVTDVQGDIIEPCSIIDPVIKMVSIVPSFTNTYVQIQAFDGRYYFVTDWKFMDGFWHVYLHLDVLASWKTVIGASTQYIERAHSAQNEYIVDQLFPSTGKMTHSQVEVMAGLNDTFYNGWFCLNITGSESDTTIGSYLCEWATFKNVISEMLLLNDDDSFWANLAQGLRNSIAKPFEHLGNVIWFPEPYFDPLSSSAVHTITLGSVTLTGTTAKPMTFYPTVGDVWQSTSLTLPKHPQASTYGKYMNLKPFSKYVYRDDLTGDVELDPLQLIDKTTFTVWKCTDPLTGTQIVALPDGQTRIAQAGVLVPMENNSLNAGGILNSVISASVGALSGNPIAVAASVVSATDSLLPTVTSTSQQGSTVLSHRSVVLDAYFWNSVGHDTNDLGNPYCATAQINTLSGYILCNEAHITGQKMTLTEAQMIESFMNSGFFYE